MAKYKIIQKKLYHRLKLDPHIIRFSRFKLCICQTYKINQQVSGHLRYNYCGTVGYSSFPPLSCPQCPQYDSA